MFEAALSTFKIVLIFSLFSACFLIYYREFQTSPLGKAIKSTMMPWKPLQNYLLRRKINALLVKNDLHIEKSVVDNKERITSIIIGSKKYSVDFTKDSFSNGSFGKVYLGINDTTKEKVIIKVQRCFNHIVASEILWENKVLLETKQLLGLFSSKDSLYTVMKFIPGKRFEEIRASSFDDRLEYSISLLKAVKKFHKAGYIHNDLHICNILCDPQDKKCYLIDFANVLRTSDYINSILYFRERCFKPPEYNILGIGNRYSDIYAVGAILRWLFWDEYLKDILSDELKSHIDLMLANNMFSRPTLKSTINLFTTFKLKQATQFEKNTPTVDSIALFFSANSQLASKQTHYPCPSLPCKKSQAQMRIGQ